MNYNKIIVVFFASVVLSIDMAGNAMAAFFMQGDLTRYVYDTNSELGSDLGAVTTLVANGGSNIDPTVTSKGIDLSVAQIGYFAYDNTTQQLYISGAAGHIDYTLQWMGTTGSFLNIILSGYKSQSLQYGNGNDQVVSLSTAFFSYYKNLDFNGIIPGLLHGRIIQNYDSLYQGNMNASLAPLTTASVTQSLYEFNLAPVWSGGEVVGQEVATITTNSDGSTTIKATPIPGAFYLICSGLMSLLGFRKKKRYNPIAVPLLLDKVGISGSYL